MACRVGGGGGAVLMRAEGQMTVLLPRRIPCTATDDPLLHVAATEGASKRRRSCHCRPRLPSLSPPRPRENGMEKGEEGAGVEGVKEEEGEVGGCVVMTCECCSLCNLSYKLY